METAAQQYWMWMKRREMVMKRNWEEKAFEEDANGSMNGGCVWPPRSYSCSFCKREFRSAQALGGHMNVHRRDRARLKHSLSLHPSRVSNDVDDLLVETNLSVGLRPSVISSKRIKTSVSSSSTTLARCFDHHHYDHKFHVQKEINNLDLELRLGDAPKVK